MSNPITLTGEQAARVLAYAVARRAVLDLRFANRLLWKEGHLHSVGRRINRSEREMLWGVAVLVADCLGYLVYGPLEEWGWVEDLAKLTERPILREPFRFLAIHEPNYEAPHLFNGWFSIHFAGESDRDYMTKWETLGDMRHRRTALLAITQSALKIIPPLPNYKEDKDPFQLAQPRTPNRKSRNS